MEVREQGADGAEAVAGRDEEPRCGPRRERRDRRASRRRAGTWCRCRRRVGRRRAPASIRARTSGAHRIRLAVDLVLVERSTATGRNVSSPMRSSTPTTSQRARSARPQLGAEVQPRRRRRGRAGPVGVHGLVAALVGERSRTYGGSGSSPGRSSAACSASPRERRAARASAPRRRARPSSTDSPSPTSRRIARAQAPRRPRERLPRSVGRAPRPAGSRRRHRWPARVEARTARRASCWRRRGRCGRAATTSSAKRRCSIEPVARAVARAGESRRGAVRTAARRARAGGRSRARLFARAEGLPILARDARTSHRRTAREARGPRRQRGVRRARRAPSRSRVGDRTAAVPRPRRRRGRAAGDVPGGVALARPLRRPQRGDDLALPDRGQQELRPDRPAPADGDARRGLGACRSRWTRASSGHEGWRSSMRWRR